MRATLLPSELDLLRRYVGDRGKIEARRKAGVCARHQRVVSQAIKRARHIALLPFTGEHIRLMGGVIAPVPGQPLTPDRPFPPRDSFGPQGSVPGGNRQQPSGGCEGGPPPQQSGPDAAAPAPAATPPAAAPAPAEPVAVEAAPAAAEESAEA